MGRWRNFWVLENAVVEVWMVSLILLLWISDSIVE